MIALADLSSGPWIIFVAAVLFFLALDLGVFHRKAHVVSFREALTWTAVWFCTAMVFAFFLAPWMVGSWDRQDTDEFLTGYITELALSMDNVFVIALIFTWFRVPEKYQHRVLFWGILGALVMRGLMIWLGVALVKRFDWMLVVLGVFLILTGIKMIFAGDDEVHPEKNIAIRIARRFFPISGEFDGSHFTTRLDGRFALTPLALVLLMVETTDLIFAVDSIPAIFGVTQDPFIIFTSNVFAILGLRSLYFVLAGAIGYFRYLKIGLSLVLVFIGLKMLLGKTSFHVPTKLSLFIVAGIILLSVAASLIAARREGKPKIPPNE